MSTDDLDHTIAVMSGNYDRRWPGLGQWFLSNAAHKYGAFSTADLSGQTLHDAFGVPFCKGT
jgi:hypothetical protein